MHGSRLNDKLINAEREQVDRVLKSEIRLDYMGPIRTLK
jgi:hypothetical protein